MRKHSSLPVFLLSGWLIFSGFKIIPQGADEATLQKAQAGQTLILNRQYAEAKKLFSDLMAQHPNSPLGSFGLMALYNAQMFENFDFSLDAAFEPIQRQNKELVDRIDKDKNASAWDNFLCGASSGLRGFYFIRKDSNLKALGEAKQARRCLERALEKDPRFMDVYLGLGLYDYWTGVFSTRFKLFPIFKDRRKEGIAQMQKAVQEGAIANDLATVALLFVYQESRNGRQGLPLAATILQKYPHNVILLNMKGNFQSYLGQHEQARGTFDQVLKTDPAINVARYYKAMDYYRA
ncbi:MAG: tetratricopeptide repeat protein, partial [Candidatus Binatia bacterium]